MMEECWCAGNTAKAADFVGLPMLAELHLFKWWLLKSVIGDVCLVGLLLQIVDNVLLALVLASVMLYMCGGAQSLQYMLSIAVVKICPRQTSFLY